MLRGLHVLHWLFFGSCQSLFPLMGFSVVHKVQTCIANQWHPKNFLSNSILVLLEWYEEYTIPLGLYCIPADI